MAKRRISEEERALLAEAMRAVTPIGKRKPKTAPASSAETRVRRKPSAAAAPARPPAPAARPVPAAPRKAPANFAAVDRRTEQKLKRGRIEIDATLDLHGLTQSLAHRRLNAFLARAALEGHRKVLVITGKGRAPEEGFMPAERRGVLREAVPRWIAEPPLCDLVWGLKPAGPRHGGAGALYVLLKRQK